MLGVSVSGTLKEKHIKANSKQTVMKGSGNSMRGRVYTSTWEPEMVLDCNSPAKKPVAATEVVFPAWLASVIDLLKMISVARCRNPIARTAAIVTITIMGHKSISNRAFKSNVSFRYGMFRSML